MKKISFTAILLVFILSFTVPQHSEATSKLPTQFTVNPNDRIADYLVDHKGYVWTIENGIKKMERVKGLSNIQMVSSISEHFYALTKDGKVIYGNKYEPDYDYKSNLTYLVKVSNLSKISQVIDYGSGIFMTVDTKGNAYWYVIEHGKGKAKAVDPEKAATNVKKAIYASGFYTAYLKKDNTLWVSAIDKYMGLKSHKPTKVLSGVKDFTGRTSLLALKTDGTVWEAGENPYSQKKAVTTKFVQVAGLKNIKRVMINGTTNYAIDKNNNNYVWGGNATGEFGNGKYSGGWKADYLFGAQYLWSPTQNTKPVLGIRNLNLLHVFNNLGTTIGLAANGYLWSWGLKEDEYEQVDWYTVYSSELPEWKNYYYNNYNNGYNRLIETPIIHPSKPARIVLN